MIKLVLSAEVLKEIDSLRRKHSKDAGIELVLEVVGGVLKPRKKNG